MYIDVVVLVSIAGLMVSNVLIYLTFNNKLILKNKKDFEQFLVLEKYIDSVVDKTEKNFTAIDHQLRSDRNMINIRFNTLNENLDNTNNEFEVIRKRNEIISDVVDKIGTELRMFINIEYPKTDETIMRIGEKTDNFKTILNNLEGDVYNMKSDLLKLLIPPTPAEKPDLYDDYRDPVTKRFRGTKCKGE